MKRSDFYYELPKELIAQKPLEIRDASRLMVVDKASGGISTTVFRDIAHYFKKGDCLVVNNTRVVPVRFFGKRKTGGKVEVFLLNPGKKDLRALIKPSKRIKCGEIIQLENGAEVTVREPAESGRHVVFDRPLSELYEYGHVPLPPYISRSDDPNDRHAYQTVYASRPGAVAAPTAGLHFTDELISKLSTDGVNIAHVTLHTGYGTFSPVSVDNIEEHKMHEEYYEINKETAEQINQKKNNGGKIITIGTTSTRVLEAASDGKGLLFPSAGNTGLFIYPGYAFKIVDAMVTNFHLPESTLLMLVSALAGKDLIFEAYRKAVEMKFRFFSYGDAMLIL